MISIKTLRMAGLTAEQIVSVLEEAEAEQREKWRINKRNQRSCPKDTEDTEDIAPISILPSSDNLFREERKTEEERSSGRRRQLTALADNWIPKDPIAETDFAEFERFKNHARANAKRYADWEAAWRNWKTSPYRSNGNGHGRPGAFSEDRSASRAAGRLAEAAKRGEFSFGPRPTLTGNVPEQGENVVSLLPQGRRD